MHFFPYRNTVTATNTNDDDDTITNMNTNTNTNNPAARLLRESSTMKWLLYDVLGTTPGDFYNGFLRSRWFTDQHDIFERAAVLAWKTACVSDAKTLPPNITTLDPSSLTLDDDEDAVDLPFNSPSLYAARLPSRDRCRLRLVCDHFEDALLLSEGDLLTRLSQVYLSHLLIPEILSLESSAALMEEAAASRCAHLYGCDPAAAGADIEACFDIT